MPKHAISKIISLHEEWKNLQKSSSRRSTTQEEKEQTFILRLDDLFDIATSDASTTVTIPEDIQFLLMQRQKRRPGSMGALDSKLARREQRRAARMDAETRRAQSSRDKIGR